MGLTLVGLVLYCIQVRNQRGFMETDRRANLRLDVGRHRALKVLAATTGRSIKELTDKAIDDLLKQEGVL
jgi:hypothetical protein